MPLVAHSPESICGTESHHQRRTARGEAGDGFPFPVWSDHFRDLTKMIGKDVHTLSDIIQASESAAQTIDWMNAIDRQADAVIQTLPNRSDIEVFEIRNSARALGRAAWRIEAACDASLLDRAKLKGGRGKRDVDEQGVDAVVRKVAAEVGVTPRTIYQNAQIHKTFFADTPERECRTIENGTLDHLEEKEYYKAALRSPDPHETLEYFARQKANDPHFSTGDAWRVVKGRTIPALDFELPAIADEEVLRVWRAYLAAGQDLARSVPAAAESVRYAVDDIKYIIETPAQTVQGRIISLIQNQGINELDPIAHAMQQHRDVVKVWLNRMVEEGTLTSRAQIAEERTPGGRGPARTYYEIA